MLCIPAIAKRSVYEGAYRVGIYWYISTIKTMLLYGFNIAQVDQLIGMVIGRPDSSIFRTLDRVGIDIFLNEVNKAASGISDVKEKMEFELPSIVFELIDKGFLGEKTGKGFYKKIFTKNEAQNLCWDYHIGNYVSSETELGPLEDAVNKAEKLEEKLKMLVYGTDKYNEFIWDVTKKWLLYAAKTVSTTGDDYKTMDRAIQMNFNFTIGPFGLWDYIGVEKSIKRMREEREKVPAWIGKQAFYKRK